MINKEYIVLKATDMFKATGIKGNTMDDIARTVGISKKTLYQLISNKRELISLIIDYQYGEIKGKIHDIISKSNNPIEELIKFNYLIYSFLSEINPVSINDLKKLYPDLQEKWQVKFKKLFADSITQSIKKGKSTGLIVQNINPEVISNIHTEKISQIHQKTNMWGKSEPPKLIKDMISYYIRGLVTRKGEDVLNKYIKNFTKYLNK